MISPWLEEIIIKRFPPSSVNNSRNLVRQKIEIFQKTGHPKVGRELENLIPELDVDAMIDHFSTDQAGDQKGYE